MGKWDKFKEFDTSKRYLKKLEFKGGSRNTLKNALRSLGNYCLWRGEAWRNLEKRETTLNFATYIGGVSLQRTYLFHCVISEYASGFFETLAFPILGDLQDAICANGYNSNRT